MSGWLSAQLPREMQKDPVLTAFVGGAEGVVDSVRERVDSLEHLLDPNVSTAALLAYLANWFGYPFDESDDAAMLRRVVGSMGAVLMRRGTAGALERLARALTGGRARVIDPGGVYVPGATVPTGGTREVTLEIERSGPLAPRRFEELVRREVPLGVSLTIVERVLPPDEGPDAAVGVNFAPEEEGGVPDD